MERSRFAPGTEAAFVYLDPNCMQTTDDDFSLVLGPHIHVGPKATLGRPRTNSETPHSAHALAAGSRGQQRLCNFTKLFVG